MTQKPLFEIPRLTVTEVTRRVRRLLEGDAALQDVWVQGEISNFSRPASGHLYFTLKDAGASLRCVMWKGDALRVRGLPLQDGLSVEAHGKIGVYEPSGQYQLIIDVLRPAGEGALYAEFMRLKALLEAEGLFAPERKRPLPNLPRQIGIVTSATGAAAHHGWSEYDHGQTLTLTVEHARSSDGEALDRSVALNRIWQDDSYFNARSMDVYITKLRKYLKEDPSVELLNVHGIGFKLVLP